MTRPTPSTLTKLRHDRGEISIETVLLVPVIIFIALIVVQAAVVINGANMASHVAAQGAMAAARHGAAPEHVLATVAASAQAVGARLASPPLVSSHPDHVVVRVWVQIPQAIPFFAEQVSREMTVPRERYIPFFER